MSFRLIRRLRRSSKAICRSHIQFAANRHSRLHFEPLEVRLLLTATPGPQVVEVRQSGDPTPLEQDERLVGNISAGASLTVTFTAAMSQAGGASGANSVINPANWQLFRDGSELVGAIGGVTFASQTATISLTSPLGDGSYQLVAQDALQDLGGNALDGDDDGAAGSDFARSFRVAKSTAVSAEFQVNTATLGIQHSQIQPPGDVNARTIAMDDDGDFVVVWSDYDIFSQPRIVAQRFDSAGLPLGSEIQIDDGTSFNLNYPEVAMNGNGEFVVAWRGDSGLVARRFDDSGIALGGYINVSAGGFFPHVGIDSSGNFAVAWTEYGANTSTFVRRFDETGAAIGTVQQVPGAVSALSMHSDGSFVLLVTDDTLNNLGVRFDVNGDVVGTSFDLDDSPSALSLLASLDSDSSGNFVATWRQDRVGGAEVVYRRFTAQGVPLGPSQVLASVDGGTMHPVVSVDDDGDFVVSWSTNLSGSGGSLLHVQAVSAQGTPIGTPMLVNSYTDGIQIQPSVAVDPDGDFVVAYSAFDASGWGVYARRYAFLQTPDDPGHPATIVDVRQMGGVSPIAEDERLVSAIPLGASLQVTFSRHMSTSGGGSVTNLANWLLKQDGVEISSQITSVTYIDHVATLTLSSPLASGVIELTALGSLQDRESGALDGDDNGVSGGNFTRQFEIRPQSPLGSEFRVNTTTIGSQEPQIAVSGSFQNRIVAMDADGDSVVTWSMVDGTSSTGYRIYAQRYNASGVAQGSEFPVGDGFGPSVAMDDDGDFVVTWFWQGVYARRFNADGVARGSEFRVDAASTAMSYVPSIAMNADGDFVIAWNSPAGDSVSARVYDALGNAQGSVISAFSGSGARVAMQADGGFVVLGSTSTNVVGLRYRADGVSQGPVLKLAALVDNNSAYTSNTSLAADAQGNLVAVWSDVIGGNVTLFAQKLSPHGLPQGPAITVGASATHNFDAPAVDMDEDGDFVVTWQSNSGDTGTPSMRGPYNIFARRFDSFGVAQGSAFMVNTYTTDAQTTPSIALDAGGDFLVAWQSYFQDGDLSGVYAQRFGLPPAPPELEVTTVVSTPSGVEVSFDAELDLSELNLYDQTGEFGAADFTIIGAVTGPVRGSLVIDTALNKIKFIPSGGPLAADTYTIVLRGGDDGFKSTLGGGLEGNPVVVNTVSLLTSFESLTGGIGSTPATPTGSGVYTTTFTVPAAATNAVTVSAPDFVRGKGQPVNVPASSMSGMPIAISSGQNVTGVDFELHYNPDLLTITGVTAGAGVSAAVTFNNSTPGVLIVTVASSSALSTTAGPVTLVNIAASVPALAAYGALNVLDLVDVSVYDNSAQPVPLPVIEDDGLHVAAYLGDGNGNQHYNAPDATFAQRIIVGLTSGLPAYPLADPLLLLDVLGNGLLQSNDVTLIQQAIVGLANSEIPLLPAPPSQTLLAAEVAAPATPSVATAVTPDQLRSIVEEGIARWIATGLSVPQVNQLQAAEFSFAKLSAGELGVAQEGVITLDDDAAGYGWFVDSTPRDDAKFVGGVFGDAIGRMDLLTVVMHELGHELGLADVAIGLDAQDLMAESLPIGLRRVPK